MVQNLNASRPICATFQLTYGGLEQRQIGIPDSWPIEVFRPRLPLNNCTRRIHRQCSYSYVEVEKAATFMNLLGWNIRKRITICVGRTGERIQPL
jgi:hypothetical protein